MWREHRAPTIRGTTTAHVHTNMKGPRTWRGWRRRLLWRGRWWPLFWWRWVRAMLDWRRGRAVLGRWGSWRRRLLVRRRRRALLRRRWRRAVLDGRRRGRAVLGGWGGVRRRRLLCRRRRRALLWRRRRGAVLNGRWRGAVLGGWGVCAEAICLEDAAEGSCSAAVAAGCA